MLLVFCRDPLEPLIPDRSFGAEAAAADRLGLPFVLVDHDALVRDGQVSGLPRPTDAEPVLAALAARWLG